ncbi:MAG TPA: DUF5681 domain-containing protein [Chlamydiales bacterium]|nr:DUF5681 domain-containing protein [Chlamydiales bacterium]
MTKFTAGQNTRFKKGQSGNPKGRPPIRPLFAPSEYEILANKTLTATVNGIPREVGMEEASWISELNLAMAGDRTAIREVYKKIARHEKQMAKKSCLHTLPMIFDYTDPENAFNALCLLDIAVPDTRCDDYGEGRRLLINPWAVQGALDRRGLKLKAQDIQNIKSLTENSSSLVWPKKLQ